MRVVAHAALRARADVEIGEDDTTADGIGCGADGGVERQDGRSDLFSVATVLYELLTGENPFRADSPTATLAQVLELEVDPDPRIEPRVWIELQRALSKQPYQRHESAAAFATSLCEAVGEPLPASLRLAPPSRSDPKIALDLARADAATSKFGTGPAGVPKRVPRRTVAVYAAALVLALSGALLAGIAMKKRPPVDAPAPSPSAGTASDPDHRLRAHPDTARLRPPGRDRVARGSTGRWGAAGCAIADSPPSCALDRCAAGAAIREPDQLGRAQSRILVAYCTATRVLQPKAMETLPVGAARASPQAEEQSRMRFGAAASS